MRFETSPSVVDLVFGTEGVVVAPVEVHLAEHVVAFQGAPAHSRVWLILHFYQHWKRKQVPIQIYA